MLKKLSLLLSAAFLLSTGVANAQIIDTDVVDVNLSRPNVLRYSGVTDNVMTFPAVSGSGCCGAETVLTQPAVIGGTSCPTTVLTQPAVVAPTSTCCPSNVLTQPAIYGGGSIYGGTQVLTQPAVIPYGIPGPVIYDDDYDRGFNPLRLLNPFNWLDAIF